MASRALLYRDLFRDHAKSFRHHMLFDCAGFVTRSLASTLYCSGRRQQGRTWLDCLVVHTCDGRRHINESPDIMYLAF